MALAFAMAQNASCGGIPCGSAGTSCLSVHVLRNGVLYGQTLWVSSTGLIYLPLPRQTIQPFPTIAQVNSGSKSAPNTGVYTGFNGDRSMVAYSCVQVTIGADGAVIIQIEDATFATSHNEITGAYAAGAVVGSTGFGAAYGTASACTNGGYTSAGALQSFSDPGAASFSINLGGTAFMVAGLSGICASGTCSFAYSISAPATQTAYVYPGWTFCSTIAVVMTYSPGTQSVSAFVDGGCGNLVPTFYGAPSTAASPIPLDGIVLASQTRSPSQSPSGTETPSQSSSRSQTQSASETRTQSASQTQTRTLSGSPSQSQSPSQTQSPSVTQSHSQSGSPSQSQSLSLTQSPSQTQSRSQSMSTSQSQSPSVTQSPSQTQSHSQSGSASQSQSPSVTQSPSQTQSSSQSGSASQSQSSSLTQSPSQTQTLSQTQSPSQTQSASPLPYQLLLRGMSPLDLSTPGLPLAGPPGALQLSDSMLPYRVLLWLSRCPDASQVAAGIFAVCSSNELQLFMTPSSGGEGRWLNPAPRLGLASACADAHRTDGLVALPLSLEVSPPFGTSPEPSGTLECNVFSGGVGTGAVHLARAFMPLNVSGTRWPLIADVVQLVDGGASAVSFLFGAINTSAAVEAACSRFPVGTELPWCAIVAVQSALSLLPVFTSTDSAPLSPFLLTITGVTPLLLRGYGPGAFTAGMSVSVGGVACNVSMLSLDGEWVAISTPPPQAICPGVSASADCGYAVLQLTTQENRSAFGVMRGATLSCPPFCPGTLSRLAQSSGVAPGMVVPYPTDTSGLGFAPAVFAANETTRTAHVTLLALPASPSGIYYAFSCIDTGLYTDPATGACMQPANPASYRCAFGSGDDCRLCPSSATCPGGFRMWPRAGFWAATEAEGSVTACAPPDGRCLGWNASAGATQCSEGFLPGSYLCGACSRLYFPKSDGSCGACPAAADSWSRYRGLLLLLAALAAAVLVVYGLLAVLVWAVGGTIWRTAGTAVQLGVWTVTTAQAVSQVAVVTSGSLPHVMVTFFGAFEVLNLQGLLLPPACSGAYPFETEVAVMGAALGLTVITVVAYGCRQRNTAALLARRQAYSSPACQSPSWRRHC
jgi:hypothetical protein